MGQEPAKSKRLTTKGQAHAEVYELRKLVRCVTTLVLSDRGFDIADYDAEKAYAHLEKWMKYVAQLDPDLDD